MSELLPLPWLYDISTCNVSMGSASIATRVVDRVAILDLGISELKSELKSSNPFVGIDIVNGGDLLLFYVKNQCLIIQYRRMMALDNQTKIPDSLMTFLEDQSITFIGPRNIRQKSTLSYKPEGCSEIKLECNRIVDIGYLAAKILMKPKLLTGTLEELMVEVGLDIKKPIVSKGSMRANWQSSPVLSNEEVQCALYEVYSCYQIFELCDVNNRFKAASSNSFDTAVKVIAAYVLAVLGGNNAPRANDLKDLLGCVGGEADDDRIELLLSQVKGIKNITELIAAAREKLAIHVPAGSASAVESKNDEKMENMSLLPIPWLLQTSIYNVIIGGDTLITTVADRGAIVKSGISELMSELKTPNPFVGIDIVNGGDLLLLYVKTRCLIIQLKRLMVLDNQTNIPDYLQMFLCSKNITFVGPRNICQKSILSYISASCSENIECKRIVDVGYLAAKMRKKPKLLTSTLEELTVEVRLDIVRPVITDGSMRPNWHSSPVLSNEEVQYAVYEVYSCYEIASKVTDVIQSSVPVQ